MAQAPGTQDLTGELIELPAALPAGYVRLDQMTYHDNVGGFERRGICEVRIYGSEIIPPEFAITNLNRYTPAPLSTGSTYYLDRSYTITSMPAHLQGRLGIKTRNDDKHETDEVWLTFDINREADIYVAYNDDATALPNWMDDYADTGERILTTDPNTDFDLYKKRFGAGGIVLGANNAPGAQDTGSNYIVLAAVVDSSLPGKPGDPDPAYQETGVDLQVQPSWSAAAEATSYDVYFGTPEDDPLPYLGNQTQTTFSPPSLDIATVYYWRINAVNENGTTPGDLWSFRTIVLPDFDGDNDVDQEDFGRFQRCLSGSGVPENDPACDRARLDGDTDVDDDDLDILHGCLSGPNVPVDPNCTD